MTREWQPGDVAMLKLNTRGGKWFQGVRIQPCTQHDYYVWQVNGGGISERAVDTARPLVLIDPEDHEQVERLYEALCEHVPKIVSLGQPMPDRSIVARKWIDGAQHALRSLLEPPKPPEPTGLGAVVEDAEGVRWVNVFEKGMWQDHRNRRQWRTYDKVAAVRVLSEGIS